RCLPRLRRASRSCSRRRGNRSSRIVRRRCSTGHSSWPPKSTSCRRRARSGGSSKKRKYRRHGCAFWADSSFRANAASLALVGRVSQGASPAMAASKKVTRDQKPSKKEPGLRLGGSTHGFVCFPQDAIAFLAESSLNDERESSNANQ